MSSKCDGIRCGKCINEENCSCMIAWPNESDKDFERYYYGDYSKLQVASLRTKVDRPLVDLDEFEIEG